MSKFLFWIFICTRHTFTVKIEQSTVLNQAVIQILNKFEDLTMKFHITKPILTTTDYVYNSVVKRFFKINVVV